MDKEIVICAAVIADNGKIYRGHRHADCMMAIRQRGRFMAKHGGREQGFITSKNRYIEREEALKLQKEAGIESADRNGYRQTELFSEDLY